MKILDQLDELNLDAAAKTQVAALVQALLDQVKKEAEKYGYSSQRPQNPGPQPGTGAFAAVSLWRKERSAVWFTAGSVRGILQRRRRCA